MPAVDSSAPKRFVRTITCSATPTTLTDLLAAATPGVPEDFCPRSMIAFDLPFGGAAYGDSATTVLITVPADARWQIKAENSNNTYLTGSGDVVVEVYYR